MSLTYSTSAEANSDCDLQKSLLIALNVSRRNLRKDECGA
jgi:hypothetical protein